MREGSPVDVAGELARRYFGAIARWQMLGEGISSSRIGRWATEAARLFPKYPGVYAWGRPELAGKGQHSAGLLFAGSGSALTGLSALWWQNLLDRRPDLIHIDSPGFAASRQDLIIRHQPSVNRSFHSDLPVVDFPRAILVASEVLQHNALRNVLANADFHDLLSFPSLQTALKKRPRGAVKVRAALASHLPALARCVNDFERDFVFLCEAHKIPIPEPNVRMGRWKPDMLWRERRLIVELDGKGNHTSAAQRIRDAAKQEWLEARGYVVIRFTWGEVYHRQGYVASEVRRHLGL